MIAYRFYKNNIKEEFFTFGVLVDKPFEYLTMIFTGTEKNVELKFLINGIEKVINGTSEDSFIIENQQGFIGYAFAPNPSDQEYPKGGFQVFDF